MLACIYCYVALLQHPVNNVIKNFGKKIKCASSIEGKSEYCLGLWHQS